MKYKRVFLIQPKYPGSFCPLPVWPLGLGYIAESLRRVGIEYRVLDLGFGYKNKFLYQKISEFKPEIIGLSLITSKYRHHYTLIKTIRNMFPKTTIVVGGPHVSTLREKVLLDNPQIDYGITGEGEETIVELCLGKEPSGIRGLIYRDNSNVIFSGERKRIFDLDSIPSPTYRGFEIEKYDTNSINILSSRGCPYMCIYCCVKLVVSNQWLMRSAKSVVDEIEYWYDFGYRIFNFNDDAFNIDRQRVLEICDEIEKRDLKIELNAPNGIRADRVDKLLLIRMKEAGFRHIAFGVEGGNNKIISNIKKGESIEEIEESIKNACELGYEVSLFFLIGSPGENEQDIEDSFRLASKYPIVDVRFYNLIPFPNTELYDWIETNNYFIIPAREYLNGNMMWFNKPVFFTPELSLRQRQTLYKRGLRLGDKLRKRSLLCYYRRSLRRFGIFGIIFAYLASRSISQFLLNRSKILQNLRIIIKRRGYFRREYLYDKQITKLKYRLAILLSHVTSYHPPLFNELAGNHKIDLMVYFCTDYGLKEKKDPGFSKAFKWDISLLDGYRYKLLKNFSLKPGITFFGQMNFEIIPELFRNKYDAIIIHGWMSITNWLAFFIALLTKTQVFLRAENPLNQELLKPRWKLNFKKFILKWTSRNIKAFLAIGRGNEEFYKFYGVQKDKIYFVPYAVDNKRFTQGFNELRDKKFDLKQRLGISPEKIVILFCGKLIDKKRPFDLLCVYEEVKNPNKALVYIGDGILREKIEKYIKKKNIEDVYLVGFKNQSELPKYYIIGDIFILPSALGETWGMVVNEAMNFKLPVIVSELAGCGLDLVKQNENGYTFPLENTEKLVFYLEDLIRNAEKRKQFGERSFEIIQNYSYEKDVEGILKALRRCC